MPQSEWEITKRRVFKTRRFVIPDIWIADLTIRVYNTDIAK